MSNQGDSKPTISDMTLSELEEIIENIAKKTVRKEMILIKSSDRKLLSETFGAWEDDKTEQEIIEEIYDSRNSSLSSF